MATAGDIATEVQRRVSQLSADQALAAVNRAIAWIHRQGSFSFFMSGLLNETNPSEDFALPDDIDTGKAMFVSNQPSGAVIRKIGIQDLWTPFARNVPIQMGYDVYAIAGRTMLLRPTGQVNQDLRIRYTPTFTDLAAGDPVPIPPEFEPLVADLAEAEEKRIYDVGSDNQTTLARCQDQIKVMLDGYRVVSMEEMTVTDAQQAAAEKTQLGKP